MHGPVIRAMGNMPSWGLHNLDGSGKLYPCISAAMLENLLVYIIPANTALICSVYWSLLLP